jgi:hypothetical protein
MRPALAHPRLRLREYCDIGLTAEHAVVEKLDDAVMERRPARIRMKTDLQRVGIAEDELEQRVHEINGLLGEIAATPIASQFVEKKRVVNVES